LSPHAFLFRNIQPMFRLLLICSVLFTMSAASAFDIVINEFLASNDTTATDPSGEFDDWIELYNRADTPLSLRGYFLSDRVEDPAMWPLPDSTIPPHGFVVVWADEDQDQPGLHANFKLSATGETIVIADSLGDLTDQIEFGLQVPDVSDGRYPDGNGEFRSMYPTIGAPNRPDSPPPNDESDLLFVDSLVHDFRLEFYTEHWADTLRLKFEQGTAYTPARLTFDDRVVLDSIGVRYKGNSSYELSRNTPKKPFEFKFDEYRDQSLMGVTRLNVHNGVSDPTLMRESIAYAIARRYVAAPRTTYGRVYANDDLLGVYAVVEQVDKYFLARHFDSDNGNLYKASDNGGTLEYRGDDPSAYAAEYDLKTNEDVNDWSGFIDMIRRLNLATDAGLVDTLRTRLNLDTCLRALAFNMVLSNFDSYTGSSRNFYFYDDSVSHQIKYVPWDLNESFGVYLNGWNVIEQDVLSASNLEHRPLIRRLLHDDSLRDVYLGYVRDMIDGPAHPDTISAIVDRLRPIVEPFMLADTNKLYSDQNFRDNLHRDVYVDIGRLIPGLTSFAERRRQHLRLQLSPDRVYPGDTDNNGVVDAQDILPVAAYFLTTGSLRDSVTVAWSPKRALLWDLSAATYADANGDGLVDEQDVVAIGVNWGNHHSATAQSYQLEITDQEFWAPLLPQVSTLDHSLTGDGPYAAAMRSLLETILGQTAPTPAVFYLAQNYPNPFNPVTTIRFVLPAAQRVSVVITNLLGQQVAAPLRDQPLAMGEHELQLSAGDLASGVYFYELRTERFHALRKMIVLK
jgi:hypothetical protein